MLDNVANNLRKWDREHAWPQHGDEWNRQAAVCGIAYDDWKASMVEHLIAPHSAADAHVLEIAPGHGRWTAHLVGLFGRVTAVDLSPNCIEFCKARFADANNIDYFVTDGTSLPPLADVDFVWSFDAFVHMDRAVTGAYLKEIARVLKPEGKATIHHSNVADLATHQQNGAKGWRAAMTAELFARLSAKAGLRVLDQIVYWDEQRRIGVPRLGDRITRLQKP
jgi:ubiquinone/menaquinone biosynthesis C-methylase UbiE